MDSFIQNDDGKIQLVPIKSNGQYLPVSITEASCVNLDKDLQNNIAAVGVFGPFVCTFYASVINDQLSFKSLQCAELFLIAVLIASTILLRFSLGSTPFPPTSGRIAWAPTAVKVSNEDHPFTCRPHKQLGNTVTLSDYLDCDS